jgi:hypothetical protein
MSNYTVNLRDRVRLILGLIKAAVILNSAVKQKDTLADFPAGCLSDHKLLGCASFLGSWNF